jgi:three-Cys-motif partner protein
LEGVLLSDETIWKIEPHTEAKHEILRRYLEAWLPIMSKYHARIVYLDGFAGPGVYLGGEDGSPVIALETAVKHVLQANFKEIVFFFIERDKRRAEKLEKVLAERFPNLSNKMKYHVIGAAFAPTFELVLNKMDEGGAMLAPTFAFLDPFGFSGLPMKLIGRMMKCEKCEVLVTFMVGFINRFMIEGREATLNELFATDEWKKANELEKPEDRIKFLVNLYEKQLKCEGGAQYVRSFAMTNKHNQISYYLVFGTKHPKGLEVMKGAMWKADKTGSYGFSDLTDPNQITFMDIGDEPYWVPKAAALVYNKFRGQTVPIEQIRGFVVTGTPFLYRNPILRYLEKSSPPKIVRVDVLKQVGRRAFTYPERCSVTFCS